MANAVISKIKLANGTTVDLKDAAGRADFATLLGTNELKALGTAAFEAYQSTWDATKTGEVPSVGAVKSYVDAQIESIPTFECIVCPADATKIPAGAKYKDGATEITGTMAASADTYKKIYLVKNDDAGAGAYVEYITIRSGAKGSYTYAWEAIGSTAIDLSGYVQKTRKITDDLTLENDITTAQMSTALDLKALAHASTATGSTAYDKVTGVTINKVTVSGNAAVTDADADATISRGAFTPAGAVTGNVTALGTVSVVLADAAAATDAEISYTSYTPAGTIAAVSGGDFKALKTAAFAAASAATTGAVQIEGSVTAPDITVTPSTTNVFNAITTSAVLPSFTDGKIGTFSAATLGSTFYSAGTAATWTGSSYSAPTLGDATKAAFANEGIVATVNTSASSGAADFEVLVFTAASTASAVTAQGTFSAGSVAFGTFGGGTPTVVNVSAFDGGSWTAGTFNPGTSAVFGSTAVLNSDTTAALANAPVFTGNYYSVATTDDTALKTVAFSGTAADIKANSVKYLKQVVSSAAFTGSSATISAAFSGTTVSDALVTGVTYKKADASAAFSVDVTPTVASIATSATTINVTVSAD